MRKTALFTSFFLTLASLYFLYSGPSFLISPGEMIRPLIILWLILLLLSLPSYWLTKDWNWAGLLLIVIVLGFFSRSIFAYAYSITLLSILLVLWLV
jgi:hypothetical protein